MNESNLTPPSAPQRKVNVSEVLDYMRCPALWASKWWAHKRLIGRREHAADVGKVVHSCWEDAIKSYGAFGPNATKGLTDQAQWENGLHHEMRKRWLAAGFDEDTADLRKLTAISHRAAWWWSQPLPFDKVLSVEETLEAPLTDSITLFGRLDAVCEHEGWIKHHQLKTYGGAHIGLKIRLIKRSLHESAYWILGMLKYGKMYRGTHLTLIRTLPLRQKVDGVLQMRPPAAMCVDEDLVIPEALRERAKRDIIRATEAMLRYERQLNACVIKPHDLPQHEHMCGGTFGNSECHFLEVCMRYADLDDRTLYDTVDPLEHYKESNATDAQ